MYFSKDNQTLYPGAWVYNVCRIFTALETIVINNGGRVKRWQRQGKVVNRTLLEVIRETEEKIERFSSSLEKAEAAEDADRARIIRGAVENVRADLEKYQSVNNDPVDVTQTTQIIFVLDGVYYSYSVDENPFFPFHLLKTPVIDGYTDADAAAEEVKPEILLNDCFFRARSASYADIKEAAEHVFNALISAKNSAIIRDKTRRRVPNTYNDGYHYETIYAKPRKSEIDF